MGLQLPVFLPPGQTPSDLHQQGRLEFPCLHQRLRLMEIVGHGWGEQRQVRKMEVVVYFFGGGWVS